MSGSDLPALDVVRRRMAFDFQWVCENLIRIIDKQGRSVPFVFNAVQMWVYWNLLDQELRGEPVRLWILKGRQFGLSTMFSVRQYVLSAMRGYNCLILPHLERPGKNMFAKVEAAHKRLPLVRDGDVAVGLVREPSTWLSGDKMAWNFSDFSALVVRESAENRDAGVSESYQHVHLTELPLWADAAHTMGGLFPTIPGVAGTSIVGEFTARGEGDYAHGVWVESVLGESWARGLFLPWYWHEEYVVEDDGSPLLQEELDYREFVAATGSAYPLKRDASGRPLLALVDGLASRRLVRPLVPSDLETGFELSRGQLLWRRQKLREFRGDVDLFRREYPASHGEAFRASGRRLVPPSVMDRLSVKDSVSGGRLVSEPVARGEFEVFRGVNGRAVARLREREDGRLWVFERPVGGACYVVGADTSSGVGLDFSAAVVLRVSFRRLDVVASFRGKVRPHEFARFLARLGRYYRCEMEVPANGERPRGGRPALLVVERNFHGEHVIYELDQTLKYRRLYRHDDRGKSDNWRHRHRFGFPVTRATKMPMLQQLVQVCFDDQVRIRCSRVRDEVRGLVYLTDDDSQAGAPRGGHDDLAMAMGEAVLVGSQRAEFRREAGFDFAGGRVTVFPRVGR